MSVIKKKPRIKEEELTANERELFLNAFYQGEIAPQKKIEKAPDAPSIALTEEQTIRKAERDLFLQAVTEGFKDSGPYYKQDYRPKPKKTTTTRRQLVDAAIDLHGYSVENAIVLLDRFIEKEHRRGSKTLLVVHGKGKGILKSAVWSTVKVHPLVDNFQIASAKLGGQGAIIVRINRKVRR